jgi:hypothetical protein
MRTTLTLDDDLAGLLQAQAKTFAIPFKRVVNDVIRKGLMVDEQARTARMRVIPHDFGFKFNLDHTNLNHLVDELENKSLLNKIQGTQT